MNLEDQLSETFHERTLRTDYPSTSMATIVSRARAVRTRRRRTTAIVTAAAVAAFAIPAAGLWSAQRPGPLLSRPLTPGAASRRDHHRESTISGAPSTTGPAAGSASCV